MPTAPKRREQQRGLLQICPNDRPPFADLCQAYSAAANSLGVRNHTVFLAPPAHSHGQQPAGSHISYLQMGDLTNHSIGAARLQQGSPFPNPRLVLCHRYRSYRIARAAGLPQERTIALAHEFGMLERWQRRTDRLLSARKLRYAGVSPAVVAELAEQVTAPILLPNIIDWAQADRQRLERAEARALLGIPDERFCIGVVGRLHPKKQPSLAIQTLAELARARASAVTTGTATNATNFELLFIGNGELRQSLEQQATDLPVRFGGFVADAKRYFSGLDALLMTSSRAEAFGMVALEALSAGLPVVAPAVAGIESVLAELGFYGDAEASPGSLAQALGQAMTLVHSEQLPNWQAEAKARVRREFSISAAAQRLEPLLQAPTG